MKKRIYTKIYEETAYEEELAAAIEEIKEYPLDDPVDYEEEDIPEDIEDYEDEEWWEEDWEKDEDWWIDEEDEEEIWLEEED